MFLNADTCTQYATPEQNSPHGKEEYVGMICYKQKLKLKEQKKMLRKYSKIAEFNILKTSLSLKMSNAYTSNDRIIISMSHFYSIYRLKILIIFKLEC